MALADDLNRPLCAREVHRTAEVPASTRAPVALATGWGTGACLAVADLVAQARLAAQGPAERVPEAAAHGEHQAWALHGEGVAVGVGDADEEKG